MAEYSDNAVSPSVCKRCFDRTGGRDTAGLEERTQVMVTDGTSGSEAGRGLVPSGVAGPGPTRACRGPKIYIYFFKLDD